MIGFELEDERSMSRTFARFLALAFAAALCAGELAAAESASGRPHSPKSKSKSAPVTLEARFVSFHLGDAPYYTFRDGSGTVHMFTRIEPRDPYSLARELPAAEANESNQ
ncbi:MAG: hypothetical protein KIT18_14770, partial [Burkholderiales bacterium]|nr:hypothetical protein [Burkholderiales bacterium]